MKAITLVGGDGLPAMTVNNYQDGAWVQGDWILVLVTGGRFGAETKLVRARILESKDPKSPTVELPREVIGSDLRLGNATLVRLPNVPQAALATVPAVMPVPTIPFVEPLMKDPAAKKLADIMLAIHNFYSANDVLPGTVLRGPDGKARHSWRVLILPFQRGDDPELVKKGRELFKQYDLSQPWDSESNLKVQAQMPDMYRDPEDHDSKSTSTPFVGIVREDTAFPPKGMKMKDGKDMSMGFAAEVGVVSFASIQDSLALTLGVVQSSPARRVPWTKPEDLELPARDPSMAPGPFEEKTLAMLRSGLAAPRRIEGLGIPGTVLPIATMDGRVRGYLGLGDPKSSARMLLALATCAGGEPIPDNVFTAVATPPEPSIVIHIDGTKSTASIQ